MVPIGVPVLQCPRDLSFEQHYSVQVSKGVITITDRTTELVISKLSTTIHNLQVDSSNLFYLYDEVYYFSLSQHEEKYMFSFEPNNSRMKYILPPLRDPHFIKKYVVDFSLGFSQSHIPRGSYPRTGIITIYDLTSLGKKEVKTIFVDGNSGGRWHGKIRNEKIYVTDLHTGVIKKYSVGA